MNGRTTKLLLARKKKGVVHKQRPQLGRGGIKNWSKLTTHSTKKTVTWGTGVLKIRENCRRRLWMVPKKKEGKIMESFQDCLLQHTNTTTY